MFRSAPMVRLDAVVLERDRFPVLRDLGRLGAIQLTRPRPGPDTMALAARDHGKELEQWERIRIRAQEVRQSLGIAPRTGEPALREITLADAEEGLRSIEEQATKLLDQRGSLALREREAASVCDKVSCYLGLAVPLVDPGEFQFLHFVTGSLPLENLEALERDVGGGVALIPAARLKGRQTLVAVTTRGSGEALEEALARAGFEHDPLPAISGATVDTASEDGVREREETAAESERVAQRLSELAEASEATLDELEGAADAECRLLAESGKLPCTEASVLLSGWVPADEAPGLEERMKEVTGGKYAVEATLPDSASEEEVPVLLRHSRILRPFEMLISNYGSPSYWELEPTVFVAVSYILMFGMMFGDTGHGMVLAGLGLYALLKGRSEAVKDFGLLLLFGGSSSMIFGAVYGSFFGIDFFKKYALWHDPLEGDPMLLMYGAIGFGIVMMSLGLMLNIINRFRRGDVIGGFLDSFGITGIIFFWGALILVIQGPAIQSRGLMPLLLVLFLGVPIVGWAIHEPLEHILRRGHHDKEEDGGMATVVMESFVGAFEAVLTYLANTISFVRLAAYAMSHAALLLAAFVLAREMRDLPAVGGALSLLVIILGNLVAIVLEGIIASVQALRLEYYEFFGKFFSGSGQPFKPFRLTAEDRTPAP